MIHNPNTQPSTVISNRRNDILTLITVEDLITYTQIHANTEQSQFKPFILLAQERYVKPLLGDILYNELLVEFIAVQGNPNLLPDGSTLPNATNYRQLYKECFNVLVWAAYLESIIVLGLNVTEKGITIQTNDYSDNIQLTGIKEMEVRANRHLSHFSKQLQCYIDTTFLNTRDEIVNQSVNNTPITNFIYLKSFKKHCGNCKH